MPPYPASIRSYQLMACAFAWLCWASRAQALAAAAPPERVRLVYAAALDCPTPEALERELDTRLGNAWRAGPDELAPTMTITETVDGTNRIVRVDYEDGQHRRVTRDVKAGSCEEALSMTAIVVTVAIDALAREREAAPNAEAPPSAAPPPPATPAPAPKPAGPSAEPERSASPHFVFVHEAGVRLNVAAGFGNGPAYGGGAEWGFVERSGFAVRAAIEARTTGSVPAADARARFQAVTARGEVCILAPKLGASLSLPLCAGLEAGVLWAEGVVSPPEVASTQPSVVPWVAGLFTPRLRLAGARLYAELIPELRVPFVGHTFEFKAPERLVYTVPDAAFGVSLAAGLRFN